MPCVVQFILQYSIYIIGTSNKYTATYGSFQRINYKMPWLFSIDASHSVELFVPDCELSNKAERGKKPFSLWCF